MQLDSNGMVIRDPYVEKVKVLIRVKGSLEKAEKLESEYQFQVVFTTLLIDLSGASSRAITVAVLPLFFGFLLPIKKTAHCEIELSATNAQRVVCVYKLESFCEQRMTFTIVSLPNHGADITIPGYYRLFLPPE